MAWHLQEEIMSVNGRKLCRMVGLPVAVMAGSLLAIGGTVAVSGAPAFAANPSCGPTTGTGPGLGSHHDPLADPIRICGEGMGSVDVPSSGMVPVTLSIFETYPGHHPLTTTFSAPSYVQVPWSDGSMSGMAYLGLDGVQLASKAGNDPTVLRMELSGLPTGMVQVGDLQHALWLFGFVYDTNGEEIFLHWKLSLGSSSGRGTLTGEDWVLPRRGEPISGH